MHTWLRALSLSLVLALSACGGGGDSSGRANTAPTANFAFSCVDLTCNFVNLSTTQDTSDTIIAYTWTFGDGSPTVGTLDATHTYAAASTYTVSLLVIDSQGAAEHRHQDGHGDRPAGGCGAARQLQRQLHLPRLHLHRHQHLRRRQRPAVAALGLRRHGHAGDDESGHAHLRERSR